MAEIATAVGRRIAYRQVTLDAFLAALARDGVDTETRSLSAELVSTLFDGRNAATTDGVEAVLGRPARDLTDFAAKAARTGCWAAPAARCRCS